jgi:hypothetical protein
VGGRATMMPGRLACSMLRPLPRWLLQPRLSLLEPERARRSPPAAGALQLWNVSQAQPLRALRTGLAGLKSLAFFHGSQRLLLAAADGAVSSQPAGDEWQALQIDLHPPHEGARPSDRHR